MVEHFITCKSQVIEYTCDISRIIIDIIFCFFMGVIIGAIYADTPWKVGIFTVLVYMIIELIILLFRCIRDVYHGH